jgi:anti-sigma B factor antagonist
VKADFGLRSAKRGTTLHVLEVEGELDLYTAPRLRSSIGELVSSGASELIIDFSETTFVDSTALHVLLDGRKKVTSVGGDLVIVCPNSHLRRIFEVTGVDGLLPLCSSMEDALERLAPQGASAA